MFGTGEAELSQKIRYRLYHGLLIPQPGFSAAMLLQNRKILGLPIWPMQLDQSKRWQPRAAYPGFIDRLFTVVTEHRTGRSSPLGQAD